MNNIALRVSAFVLGGWLAFRFISDWPRGASASGIGLDETWLNLSYIGLAPWILVALIAIFSITNFYDAFIRDKIAQSHLIFICFQFIGLYNGVQEFEHDGLMAGVYIILVSLTFLFSYVLGVEFGHLLSTESVGKGSKRAIHLLTLCMLPCMAIGALQLLTGTGRDVGGIPRIYGGTSSPNVMAALLLVYLGLALWSGETTLTHTRKAIIALALALFVACFSMAGIGTLSGMFGLFWLVSGLKEKRLKIRFSWIIGGLLVILATGYFANNVLVERFSELGNNDNSLTWRIRTWMGHIALLSDVQFFLVGGGLGFDHLGLTEEPHNEWLRVLLETGVIGLCLFIRIWWVLIRSLFEISNLPDHGLRRRAYGLIAVTGGIVVWAMADSVIRTAPSALLLWGSVGILVGSARSYYRRLPSRPQMRASRSATAPSPSINPMLPSH